MGCWCTAEHEEDQAAGRGDCLSRAAGAAAVPPAGATIKSELAIGKIGAGTPVKDVDMMVRGFISDAGYGDFFGHGTGHGVGIAVHEDPAINSNGEGLLEEGMVITIEPGIYIPNLGGVRLEDMVLVTADTARSTA
ncbi:MAG: M24 family metallopeptidase [Anaerolineales bacterium]|nr:M24 family metallopeptidase [Anaerolineales bacterium]